MGPNEGKIDDFTAPVLESMEHATRGSFTAPCLDRTECATREGERNIHVTQQCEDNCMHVKLTSQTGDIVGNLERLIHERKILNTLARELNRNMVGKKEI